MPVLVLFCYQQNRIALEGEMQMIITQKTTGRASSVPAGLAAGVGVSIATTILVSIILAILLDREVILWKNIGYGILIMIMLSAFLGAVTANHKIRRQKIVISCMSGLAYWGLLLTFTALFFGGKYEAVDVTALLVMAGCGCAAMLEIKKGRGIYTGKRKKPYYKK